jgi:hypothetical protein
MSQDPQDKDLQNVSVLINFYRSLVVLVIQIKEEILNLCKIMLSIELKQ